jgi:hypothetical protein
VLQTVILEAKYFGLKGKNVLPLSSLEVLILLIVCVVENNGGEGGGL